MNKEEEYFEINKALWNEKTQIHADSNFYGMDAFKSGQTTLKSIEIDLLGDISNKTLLHLQCHFGQDTLSLARMGAKATGLDISDEAVNLARDLNNELGLDAEFVCCDLYSAKEHINKQFDIVFSSYGTIGWLPDINRWAEIVNHFLKPGGKFVFVELHPFIWMHDDSFKKIAYSYFNQDPIIEVNPGTYAQQDADIEMTEIGWNHGLAEVISALLKQGLRLNHFEEFNYSPHNCFKDMAEIKPGQFVIKHFEDKAPMTYSVVFTKD